MSQSPGGRIQPEDASNEKGRSARPSAVRFSLLAVACATWGAWWLSADQGYPDYAPFLVWVAALLLFAIAFYHPWPMAGPDWLTPAFVVMLVIALLPRVIGSEFAPYEVTLDEAIHPLLGAEVLLKEPWRIFDGVADHFNTPYLDLILQALLPRLRGARHMSAILSAISLVATYGLAKRLYDRPTAVFATIVLGCAYWHIAVARTGYPFMQSIAIAPLALWVLATALQEKNAFLLFVGGVLLGVSALVYTPGRIVVPVFLVWWLCGVVLRRYRLRTLLPIILGLAVFMSPFLHRNGHAILLSRFRGAAAGATPMGVAAADGWFSGTTLTVIAAQVETAARIYSDGGGWMAPHSAAPGPLLDAVTLGLAIAGLLLSIVRWRRAASSLLLIWAGATFIGGQVLTDVPQAAYRAGPLLPALAIAAGSTIEWVVASVRSRTDPRGYFLRLVLAVALLSAILPPNLRSLNDFLEARLDDPAIAIARLVGHGDPALTYFVVDIAPNIDAPRFQLLAGGRDAREVPSLGDLLGPQLAKETGPHTKGAVIILGPPLRTAEQVVRRCYPGAVPMVIPHWSGGLSPPVVLRLSPRAIAAGRECALTVDAERGLRAQYYRGDAFDGEIVRQGLDDWPMRWIPSPHEGFGSVEWRAYFNAPIEGTYQFRLSSTSVGSTAAIGKDFVVQVGESKTVQLAARPYPVTLRFRAEPSTFYALYWVPPGGECEVVPPVLFSPYPRNRSDRRWVE